MTGFRKLATTLTSRPLLWVLLVLATASLSISLWRAHGEADVLRADPEAILGDPALRRVALAGGKPVYEDHCASCHGAAGKRDETLGSPDLTDADHLYGTGTVAQIED